MTDPQHCGQAGSHISDKLRALPFGTPGIDRLVLFLTGLPLCLLALELLKAGAGGVAPLTQDMISLDDPVTGLAFGWISSYFVLSGPPIAGGLVGFFFAILALPRSMTVSW